MSVTTELVRINVGSGEFPLPGYINVEKDPILSADVHASVPPLPFDDDYADEIWAAHFIEHISQQRATRFLNECRRVLKPGGRLGVLVPDMQQIMLAWLQKAGRVIECPPNRFWNMDDLDDVNSLIIFSTIQDSHHLWSYDEFTLGRAIERAGLELTSAIDRMRDPRIIVPSWWQCGWNARKPERE